MKTKLILKDEVNCKFEGLALTTRRTLEKKLKFFMPYAYHVPAYKLGRWDGCVGYFTMGGATFVNCLPYVQSKFLNKMSLELKLSVARFCLQRLSPFTIFLHVLSTKENF